MLIQQFINGYIFSSIKETNWLISKGMCVLLFDVFNGCSLVKNKIYLELLLNDILCESHFTVIFSGISNI